MDYNCETEAFMKYIDLNKQIVRCWTNRSEINLVTQQARLNQNS
jgi:hypothetical protein